MGDAVGEHRLHARPGREDLAAAGAACGGIARMGCRDVTAHLADDAGKRAKTEHPYSVLRSKSRQTPGSGDFTARPVSYGAKNGVDT